MSFDFLPRAVEHPAKAVFKRHGIQLYQVAAHLGRSYSWTSRALSGKVEVPDGLDHKLHELARMIEQAAGAGDDR